MKRKILIILNLLLLTNFWGCKKLVEVDGPKTSLNTLNVYENDATAISVLTGLYTQLSGAYLTDGGLTGTSYFCGLSADELSLTDASENLTAYYTNSLTNQLGAEMWNKIYPNIYTINATIEGVTNSSSLTLTVKNQLLGEAKFMRAFCFFYLVNLFGDVPLTLTTDYKVNAVMPRMSKDKVWEQIIIDLTDAKELLSSDYMDVTLQKVTVERVRPNKWSAMALLARSYLFLGKWEEAEEISTDIVNNSNYDLVELNQVFKKNNKEALWQLQPVISGSNTQEANTFIINYITDLSYKPALTPSLISSFESGDQRKNNWVNNVDFGGTYYYYAYKYKVQTGVVGDPVTEYSTCLRLAEQYLIRAEARIQQGKISDGLTDLNVLRLRATDKLAEPSTQLKELNLNLSKENALKAVEHERQIELFGEWGHRWLDLKRTGRLNEIMSLELPKKVIGGVWKPYQQLYPIPLEQIRLNPQLKQNSDY